MLKGSRSSGVVAAAATAPILFQVMLLGAAVLLLLLMPPARGPMLVLPIGGHAGSPINTAIERGGLLLGRGPVDGSFVVVGDRAKMLPALVKLGALVVAGRPSLCGDVAIDAWARRA